MIVMLIRRLALLLLATLVAACSIQLSDSTPVPTVVVPEVVPPDQATATARAAAVTEQPGPGPEWQSLGLSGRLVYSLGVQGVRQLDLSTGVTGTVFTVPKDGWLTAVAVAPDQSAIALAYAPPPPTDQVQLGYTDIYLLPGDCLDRAGGCTAEHLQPLLQRSDPHEAYFSPLWSPDGQHLYFAHFTPSDAGSSSPYKYTLERLPLPSGAPEVLLEDALWPTISPDGSRLAYVYTDPEDYTNHLYVANADGSEPTRLLEPDVFEAVDAPLFAPDGEQLVFSAVGSLDMETPPPASAWLDWLTGVRAAAAAPEAHNVPSDWWRMPLAGGPPERLTRVADTGMFGAFSPSGQHIAYLSASGLYVMQADGSSLVTLSRDAGYGTIGWIP